MNPKTLNALGYIAAGLFLPAVFAVSLAHAAEGTVTVTTSAGTTTVTTIFPGSATATSKAHDAPVIERGRLHVVGNP